MKIETQYQEDHQVKITAEIEPDQMESMKRRAARKIAKRVKVPGFRPGKAPYQVIARQVGEGTILEEALELLIDEIYPKMLDEADIRPYGPGSLENVVSMDPPVLEFSVPLEAEVEVGDYHSIQKPYEPGEISSADVDEFLENMRERFSSFEPVDRPAEEGNLVTVQISARQKDSIEDKDAVIIEEQTVPLLITEEKEDNEEQYEWPFNGFSRNLIGVKEGDEIAVSHKFPEDSQTEKLAGMDIDFHIAVENVKVRHLPELDDAFATSLGEYENLETLRDEIHSSLKTNAQNDYDEEYNDSILDQAIADSTFKYPPQMIEHEVDIVIDNLEANLKRENMDMDLYLMTRNMDMDGLKEDVRPVAESRLKRRLFLIKLADKENIQVASAELQAETAQTVNYLAQSMSKNEARKLSNKTVLQNLMGNIFADILTRRSMEHFHNMCSGKLDLAEDSQEIEETGDKDSPVEAQEESQDAPTPDDASITAQVEENTVREEALEENTGASTEEPTNPESDLSLVGEEEDAEISGSENEELPAQ